MEGLQILNRILCFLDSNLARFAYSAPSLTLSPRLDRPAAGTHVPYPQTMILIFGSARTLGWAGRTPHHHLFHEYVPNMSALWGACSSFSSCPIFSHVFTLVLNLIDVYY